MQASIIVLGMLGLLTLIYGYLIRYRQMVAQISGLYEKQAVDQAGFTNWIGNHLILIGFLSTISALKLFFDPQAKLLIIYLLLLLLLVVRLWSGKKRYLL